VVRTIGVDLAAEAANTAWAAVNWNEDGTADLDALHLGADDQSILTGLRHADWASMDCPFGWPDTFVEFLTAHRDGHVSPPTGLNGLTWRRTLTKRETDLEVRRVTGINPLPVAADRIAAVAMRGAGLLGALAQAGIPVDRAGGGRIVEAYPAAAMKLWGLPHQSYKGPTKRSGLAAAVDALQQALPGLRLRADHEALCRRSDDALDAVICAILARAAAVGDVSQPPPNLRDQAAREGWIVLPVGPLAAVLACEA